MVGTIFLNKEFIIIIIIISPECKSDIDTENNESTAGLNMSLLFLLHIIPLIDFYMFTHGTILYK